MEVTRVTNNSGYDSYAARVYRQQLDQVHAQQIVDRRQKIKEEEKLPINDRELAVLLHFFSLHGKCIYKT